MKQRLAFFVMSQGICLAVSAQCPPVVSPNPGGYPAVPQIATLTIADFGAVPNDACSDHDAFRAAANWINQRGGYTTLRIGAGEYIVGRQGTGLADGNCLSCYTEYENPFKVVNCENVSVIGPEGAAGTAIIRFEDCLKYGAFQEIMGIDNAMVNVNCGNPVVPASHVAQVGAMLWFDGCRNITVAHLDLHGNLDGMVVGGKYNMDGFQLWYDGMIFSTTQRVVVKSINAHHFGRDGMIVCSSNDIPIDLYSWGCQFNENGRLGASWGGGNTLTFENCSFSLNGTGRIVSKPASGFDAERESSNPICTSPAEVHNGYFKRCRFIGNHSNGFITDQPTGTTRRIRFEECQFQASARRDSYTAWQRSKAIEYTNCVFYGQLGPCYSDPITSWPVSQPDYRTKFRSCQFLEEDGALGYVQPPLPGNCEYFPNIVEIDGIAARVLFERCTFNVNCKARVWLRGMTNTSCAGLGCPPEANYIDMVGCKVVSRGREFCSQPWPEEPFTFSRINLQNSLTTVSAPAVKRPPGTGPYYWGPTAIVNGPFGYGTFPAPPHAPCLPLYTDPPILVPTITCGQPAPIPIPNCTDETVNMPQVVTKSIRTAPVVGDEVHLSAQHCLNAASAQPYRMLDSTGRLALSGTLPPQSNRIDVSGLGSGWYTIVMDDTGCVIRCHVPK